MFINLVLNFADQIFVELLLGFLHLGEQTHYVTLASVCWCVRSFCFINDLLGNCGVLIQELVAHSIELRCLFFKFDFDVFKSFATFFQQLGEVKTTVNIGLLQMMERLMCRLKSYESQPIRLIVYWRQHYTSLLKFLAMQVLEAHLNKFDSVFCFDLAQVKYDQVKHLLHLHGVFLIFVFLLRYLVDNWRKTQLDKSLYSLEYVCG